MHRVKPKETVRSNPTKHTELHNGKYKVPGVKQLQRSDHGLSVRMKLPTCVHLGQLDLPFQRLGSKKDVKPLTAPAA